MNGRSVIERQISLDFPILLSFIRRPHPLQLWDVCLDSSESGGRGLLRRIKASVAGHHSENSKVDDADVNEVSGPSIELSGARLSQNYAICPPMPKLATARPSLGIKLPYLYLTVHVPRRSDFSFEVTILDDRRTIRRFRASTYQSNTVIRPDICAFPLRLEGRRGRPTRDSLLLPSKKRKVESKHNPCEGSKSYDNSSYYGPGAGDGGDDDDDEGDDESESEKVSCWNRLCIPLSEYAKRAYGTNYLETMWVQVHANCQLKRVYFAEREMDEDDELPEEFRLYYRPAG
eukprot:CAMPEP_0172528144 /NCGR_PEP_ID=MMETSP1067-20121228/2629_1 /TAXON_ID=265564 ORGANISM="Thalassiosira punctigera, Strain Tpunct2005C2" /NCGR_SAMPLE_ID=MMETSP1067 /ASSEMBLY_ACC=CAM_ASM_000444 /LENGTH=288 /DNA_ID=CAMNT_0013312009 /DNA_START=366 /DNA_END=1232 /DNA_ORIENTATION=+